MLRTFNCGIGMVLVVDSSRSDDVMAELQAAGEQCFVIGQLKQRAGEAVELSNETTGW
jgi:phosphoribosylformylglycinamidine cyclo-ligase